MKYIKKEIRHFSELAFQFSKIYFNIKTEGSYLGLFWHILNPLILFVLLLFIFRDLIGQNIEYYPVYLFLGLIIFNYFQYSTTESTSTFLNRGDLFNISNFDLRTMPVGVALSNTFTHSLEILILSWVMIYYGLPLYNIIFYFPVFLFILIFVTGFNLLLSAITVYIADMRIIWTYGIRLLWFATPVFYQLEKGTVVEIFNKSVNPLYYFIEASRQAVIYGQWVDAKFLLPVMVFSLGSLVFGLLVFNILSRKIPELV